MTKTGEQAAKEAPETAQVLRMSDYKPKSTPPTFPRFRKVPCLVDEKGGLIAGHGRVLAAKQLGLDEVPVVVARGSSEAQKRAYVIADNKLTENGGWDDALLAAEMADLKGLDFDITLTGFALDDIETEAGDGIEDAPDSKYKEQFGVIVICKDEAHQQGVFEELAGSGYEVRVVVT